MMAIPIGDDNPTRRRGWVTIALVITNVVVFVLLQPWDQGACGQQAFYARWGAIANEIIEREPLDQRELDTAVDPRCEIESMPDKSVALSILTAMFLHAGWGHLIGNMLFLLIFGDNVEERLGRLQYLLFYIVCGAIATVVFAAANPASTTTLVGASGAIAGVLGAYLVMYPAARVTVLILPFFVLRLPALLVLGVWFLMQLAAGDVASQAGAQVAYLAHVAGFVAGAVIVLLLGERPRRPTPRRWAQYRPRRY